jgi:ABC-2 type transport system permease protein
MFLHIYKNRLKCLLRSRGMVFWTLLFPIVLAVFFSLAFDRISDNSFQSIPIGVVDSTEYQSNTAFITALNSVSDENSASNDKLFHISLVNKEQAESSLDQGNIEGYVYFDNGPHVAVKSSGIDQSILKQFMDSYLQTASAYTSILQQNPTAAQNLVSSAEHSYLEQVPTSKASNSTVAYYYALMAMAALYGSFWGKKEVEDIQADMSAQGARVNLTPVHKLKAFFSSFCASITVHFATLVLLVGFLVFALKVDFGPQIGPILLACFGASLMGVSFGAAVASLVKKGSTHLRMGIMLAISMVSSCLAGLNNISIKYAVTHAVPALAYINPANLVADAFYALYYYSGYDRFLLNLGLMLALSALFLLIVYFATRRRKYASI